MTRMRHVWINSNKWPENLDKTEQWISKEFETSIGARGDITYRESYLLWFRNELSIILEVIFRSTSHILYLRQVRVWPTLISAKMGAEDSEYSDNIDLYATDLVILSMLPIKNVTFSKWNLEINESMSEFVHFKVARKGEKMGDVRRDEK